jgi:hypothetical protein
MWNKKLVRIDGNFTTPFDSHMHGDEQNEDYLTYLSACAPTIKDIKLLDVN